MLLSIGPGLQLRGHLQLGPSRREWAREAEPELAAQSYPDCVPVPSVTTRVGSATAPALGNAGADLTAVATASLELSFSGGTASS